MAQTHRAAAPHTPDVTQAEVISLTEQMRALGVAKFRHGDVEVEFFPAPAPTEPEPREEDLLFASAPEIVPRRQHRQDPDE